GTSSTAVFCGSRENGKFYKGGGPLSCDPADTESSDSEAGGGVGRTPFAETPRRGSPDGFRQGFSKEGFDHIIGGQGGRGRGRGIRAIRVAFCIWDSFPRLRRIWPPD